jgi:hypothetical protein
MGTTSITATNIAAMSGNCSFFPYICEDTASSRMLVVYMNNNNIYTANALFSNPTSWYATQTAMANTMPSSFCKAGNYWLLQFSNTLYYSTDLTIWQNTTLLNNLPIVSDGTYAFMVNKDRIYYASVTNITSWQTLLLAVIPTITSSYTATRAVKTADGYSFIVPNSAGELYVFRSTELLGDYGVLPSISQTRAYVYVRMT